MRVGREGRRIPPNPGERNQRSPWSTRYARVSTDRAGRAVVYRCLPRLAAVYWEPEKMQTWVLATPAPRRGIGSAGAWSLGLVPSMDASCGGLEGESLRHWDGIETAHGRTDGGVTDGGVPACVLSTGACPPTRSPGLGEVRGLPSGRRRLGKTISPGPPQSVHGVRALAVTICHSRYAYVVQPPDWPRDFSNYHTGPESWCQRSSSGSLDSTGSTDSPVTLLHMWTLQYPQFAQLRCGKLVPEVIRFGLGVSTG